MLKYGFKPIKDQTEKKWKMSVFGVILVRNSRHLAWIRKDTPYLPRIQSKMRENTDQNNSKYGQFLRSKGDYKLNCDQLVDMHYT